MKLINFRCPQCGYEEEWFEDVVLEVLKKKKTKEPSCPSCTAKLREFNFKNNKQRWKYCDAEHGE
jgi:hypothetical protein